jgi:hypothetical protein
MPFKKKWFSNKVESTDGYSVNILSRSTILYEEQDRSVIVSAEMLAPKHTWALYPEDMWIGSVRGEQLQDEALRALIVMRIQDAFQFLGLKLEL